MSYKKTLLAFSVVALVASVAELHSVGPLEIKDGENAGETKTVEQQAAEIKAAMDKQVDVVKELAEKAVGMAEKLSLIHI